jgi:putative oxidoreductase
MDYLTHGLGLTGVALAANRIAVGAFFAFSGYHKLFNRARHASLVSTLTADRVPLLAVNQWFVPSVEMLGGLAVALGVFAPVAAVLLMCICAVATCVDGLARVAAWKPIDWADWCDDLLYLPEVLYGLMLLIVLCAGPGRASLT